MIDEEAGLIARAARGDADAFGQLALGQRARLRGLLHRLVGPADLDDVEQDAFLAAWRGIGGFRGDASFSTWLTKIAVRRAMKVLKRRQIVPATLTHEPVSGSAGPADRTSAAERNGRVLDAVDALPAKLRVAFVLRFVEEMSGEEVARVLGVPHGTVRSRLHEARRRLAQQLGEDIEA